MQTCATVEDVCEFCKKHPFTLNLVCSDSNGGVFCAHQTVAGTFELSGKAPFALTNHVVNDMIIYRLCNMGVTEFIESPTTRFRRGRMMEFYSERNAGCEGEDVRRYMADRMNGDISSICPDNNVVMTYANSQAEPGIIWVSEPQSSNSEHWQSYTL